MRLFILLILFNSSLSPQNKIVKILNSNLFQLDNGMIIRMAGVETPSVLHPNDELREAGLNAQQYAKNYFLNHSLEIESVSGRADSAEVYIFRNFPFYKEFYNKKFLEEGFGRFKEVPDTGLSIILKQAESEAKDRKRGIWEYIDSASTLVLDTSDANIPVIKKVRQKGFYIVPVEIICGAAAGFLGGMAGSVMFTQLSGEKGWNALPYAFISFYISYNVASAASVHLIAREYNPDLDYGTTLLCSMAGSAASFGFLFWGKRELSNGFFITSLALPVTGSVLYSNLAAFPQEKYSGNHQDIINLDMVSIDLLRIRL